MSHLYCPRCQLDLAFRFPSLPARNCPRCLGYQHITIELRTAVDAPSKRSPARGAPSARGLEADLRRFGSTRVIELAGELDIATVHSVQALVHQSAVESDGIVLIDLGGLAFMDLSGLRVLLAAHERLGERLRILPGRHCVQRLFELTKTLDRLPFTDDIHVDVERPGPVRPPSPRVRVSRPVGTTERRSFSVPARMRARACD